jgi:hypothetical protein
MQAEEGLLCLCHMEEGTFPSTHVQGSDSLPELENVLCDSTPPSWDAIKSKQPGRGGDPSRPHRVVHWVLKQGGTGNEPEGGGRVGSGALEIQGNTGYLTSTEMF